MSESTDRPSAHGFPPSSANPPPGSPPAGSPLADASPAGLPPPGSPPPGSPPADASPAGLPPPGETGGPSRPSDNVPVYDRGTPGAGRRTIVLTAVAALVIGLAGGFVAGRQTAPKGPATLADAVRLAAEGQLPTGTFTPGQGGFGGLFRGNGGQGAPSGRGQSNGSNPQSGPFNRGIQATVSSVDGDVVTVQTGAGQVRVRIGPDTKIQKATAGSKADLKPGNRVVVTLDVGRSSNDGSVTASSILSQGAAS